MGAKTLQADPSTNSSHDGATSLPDPYLLLQQIMQEPQQPAANCTSARQCSSSGDGLPWPAAAVNAREASSYRPSRK